MTTRELILSTALFDLDFAGIDWVLRPQTQAAMGGMDVFVGVLVCLVAFFGTILLFLVLI